MAEIINYEMDWEGHTGSEVQSFLKQKLKEAESQLTEQGAKLNESMTDIKFEVDKNNGNRVNVTKSYTGKEDQTVSFQLQAVSSYTAALTIDKDSVSQVIKQGKDLLIAYTWEVRSGTTKVANIKADINIEITCGTQSSYYKVPEKSVATVRSITDTVGNITIPANKLFEGENKINIIFNAIGGDGGRIETNQRIVADVLNPILTCSMLSTDSYNKMRNADTDKFTINFQVTNSKGGALTVGGKTVTSIKRIFYGGFENYKVDDITKNSYTNTFSGLVQAATGSTTALARGMQKLFIEAYVSIGTTKIHSNMVMITMFCNNNTDDNYVQFATMQDVPNKNTGDVTVIAGQYDTKEFKVYAYANSDQTLEYIYNNNGTDYPLSKKELTAKEVIDVSYNYVFRSLSNNQKFIFKAGNSQFGFKVDVNSINSSIEELTNQAVSLSAAGKTQSDHEWVSNGHIVKFAGFDWSGNGWIDNALRVNNGASAIIEYNPLAHEEFTACFRYQAPNGTYSTVNGEGNKVYEPLISCMQNGTGFTIYPEKAELFNKGVGISTEFNSDEIHDITFVRYGENYQYIMEIFVDGVSQCACKVDPGDIVTHNSQVSITASHTQLNVYNIDLFDYGVSFTGIQSLFCFHKSNSTDIIEYIENNNVFGTANTTQPGNHTQDLTIDSLPVGSVYMLIKAFGQDDPRPWETINHYPGTDADAYKGIRHIVGNILIIQKTADGSAHPRNVCFDRGSMSAQGTSSMAYPVKNFRIYTEKTISKSCPYYNSTPVTKYKKAGSGDLSLSNVMVTACSPNIVIQNDGANYTLPEVLEGTVTKCKEGSGTKCKYPLYSKSFGDSYTSAAAKLWCLKADYAESSGSHNTGFARMANFALTTSKNICSDREASSLTPPQQVVKSMGKDAEYTKDIRTTIDGYPIYLFFEDPDGNQIYHGKYNINNEKKSEDVFGFSDITDYQNNPIVQAEGDNLKQLFNDVANGYLDSTHETFKVNDKKYLNPVECWEFSNNTFTVSPENQNVIGAFQYPYTEDPSYPKAQQYPGLNPFTVRDGQGNLAWLSQAWEYRYPDWDSDSEANILYTSGACKPFILDSIYKWLYKHSYVLTNDYNKLNEFASELHLYFNVNSLLKYFILTKWFGAVDQRIKNCMLAIWCDPTAVNNTNPEYPTGHMRAYYIFYDNDTILGVDNAGSLTQDWDIDENVYPGYGKHAIWDNLEMCYKAYVNGNTSYGDVYELGKLVEEAYASLREVLTDDNINQYLFTDQEDKFPDAVHNLDAEVKYFYVKTVNPDHETQPDGLAKFQGNRKWHRKRWLKKRTAWMDSKFKAGNYTEYSYKFKVGGTSGTTQEGGKIKLTSAIKDWRFFATNTTGQVLAQSSQLVPVDGVSELNIKPNSFSISDFVTIGALYGCKKIDFSEFKVTTWFEDLKAGANVLPFVEEFVLNNLESPYKQFTQSALPNLLQQDNQVLFPNLVKLYMCNAKIKSDSSAARFATLDLSKLYNLELIDARGTDVDLKLPDSSNLKQLYLQSPIEFSITNKPNLTTLNIIDDTKIKTIVAGSGNNAFVYNRIFALIEKKVNETGFTASITMGTSDEYYPITDEQITKLLLFGEKGYNKNEEHPNGKVEVKGYVINKNISAQDASALATYFPKLLVSTSISSSLTFTSTQDSLTEGSTLRILLNNNLANVNNWKFKIDNVEGNTLDGKIEVTTNTSWIEFKALPSETNTDEEHTLKISAIYGEQEFEYDKTIPIQYIKIIGAYVTAESNILRGGQSTKLTVGYIPENNTKSEWVKNKLEWKCDYGEVNSSNIYTMKTSNTNNDDTIRLSITGIDNIAPIYITYDKLLYTSHTVEELQPGGSSRWVYLYMRNTVTEMNMSKYSNGIYVSTLHNEFQLTKDWYTIVEQATTVNDESGNPTPVILDFSNLKYFKYPFADFTIPNCKFTSFNIPESKDITYVSWNIVPDDYYGYGTIVFPPSMLKGSIKIKTNKLIPELVLDLSKTSITKIYNAGDGEIDNKAFSVHYELTVQDFSPAEKSLFVFPDTLEILGNYQGIDDDKYPLAIFNISDLSIKNGNNDPGSIIYPMQGITKTINLGALYGYNAIEQGANNSLGQSATLIENLYYAHYDGNNLPNTLNDTYNYSIVKRIGSCSFDNEYYSKSNPQSDYFKGKTIQINSGVSEIGYAAFKEFTGTLKSTSTKTIGEVNAQEFISLSEIGDYAFAYIPQRLDLYLSGVKQIGDYAFIRPNDSDYTHHIYINQDSGIELASDTSFGASNTNPIELYMSEALYNIMKESTYFQNAETKQYIHVNKITFS